ncbi:MAG: type III-A CRISPR-associated protein Csm2 [Saprospiraceae bacterium]|nr:type III-A CRISPR-associated protein Csm2 [Lewinella sp.]
MAYQPKTLKPEWIKDPNGLNRESIKWAQEFGEFLAEADKSSRQKELSTSQIRKFFGQVKRLQAQGYDETSRTDLLMLSPQLAYAVGRDKKKVRRELVDSSKIHYFYDEVQRAMDAVDAPHISDEKQYFKNFVNLIEAIVAYHRFAGGE